jgi:hypothetical protein
MAVVRPLRKWDYGWPGAIDRLGQGGYNGTRSNGLIAYQRDSSRVQIIFSNLTHWYDACIGSNKSLMLKKQNWRSIHEPET